MLTIMNTNVNAVTSAGFPILFRKLESARIHADLMYYDRFAEQAELQPDWNLKYSVKVPKTRTIPRRVILQKERLDRKWSWASKGYDAVTEENLGRMAGAATYLAIRAKAHGRFAKKQSFLQEIDSEGVQHYESGEWYSERVKVTDPETGEKHFLKDADGNFTRVVIREDNGYIVGSKHADNVLRQRMSSQLGTGRKPNLFVREGIKSEDLSIANDYDDYYQEAILGMLEHLKEHGGVDDGETFRAGGRRVGNQWKKQYTRQSTQQLVNTDENGERLPDGRFRKIRRMVESIDVNTNDVGDRFWKNINGSLTQADDSGIDDGAIDEVARVDWMKGFIQYAMKRLPKRQGACFRILIDKRDQITKVPAKNGKTRTVLGATLADINKAVYNGEATEQTVSKLKRDTQKNMLKLRRAYDGFEEKRKVKREVPQVPAWYKGNPVDTTHGTEYHK